jgi:putative CocE/NonD family hydrolase
MSNRPRPPRRPADLLTAMMSRQLRLEPKRNKITIDRGVRVPMRDGAILLADHFAPVGTGVRPTVLMRCPYGRGWQFAMLARPLAERGYHVLLQSARGTFGSGGRFTPGADEAADGQDTVAWLRTQSWFDGRLAAAGPSYLAYAAWALALDPPPELAAMAVYISPHDLAAAGFGQGAFELYNLLSWSDLMAHQERHSAPVMIWRTITADKRLARIMNRLPIAATAAEVIAEGAPWYAEWLEHQDSRDPYWAGYSAAPALERSTVPTLLISGFHDWFVEQTTQQYQALRQRGVPARLVIGPWTHMTLDMGVAIRETLAWLDAIFDGNEAAAGPVPSVRAWCSGANQWHDLEQWPPAEALPQTWYLRASGGLAAEGATAGVPGVAPRASTASTGDAGETTFRYDPADPAPAAGGRTLSMRNSGSQDNTAVEAREDVLTFSTEPLERAVRVAGVPVVRLHLTSDSEHHDIFARLCDVDEDGKSGNLTDQIMRSAPGEAAAGQARELTITLTNVSHVFLPGHRIRLQVTGGAHPRFARNLGTGADPITGTATAVVTHRVHHDAERPSALMLPVVAADPQAAATAAEAGAQVTTAAGQA